MSKWHNVTPNKENFENRSPNSSDGLAGFGGDFTCQPKFGLNFG